MKKILAPLKQGWVISLLGLLALAVFVWVAGPFIAIAGYKPLASQTSRLIFTLPATSHWRARRVG
jgi:type VI secretion system protein ImpL